MTSIVITAEAGTFHTSEENLDLTLKHLGYVREDNYAGAKLDLLRKALAYAGMSEEALLDDYRNSLIGGGS